MSCSFLVIVGSHFKNTVFFWRISFFIYFGLHIHILLLFYIFYIFIFSFIMFLKASSCCDANKNLLSRHLLLQSQQWKHLKKVRNLLKVNNKDIRTSCLLDSYHCVRSVQIWVFSGSYFPVSRPKKCTCSVPVNYWIRICKNKIGRFFSN